MKNRIAAWIVWTVCFASIPVIAGAADTVSVIPPANGEVSLTESNGQVTHLKSTFPLKDGCPMQANGGYCTVKGPSFNFTAENKTRFAINQEGRTLDVSLNSGKVRYVLKQDASVKFTHPGALNQEYDIKKITPGPDGTVKGYASVQGDKLVLVNEVGQLEMAPIIGGVAQGSMTVAPSAAGISGAAVAVGAGGVAVAGGAAAASSLSSGYTGTTGSVSPR